MKKLSSAILVTLSLLACMSACDALKHEHISLGWEFNEREHWQGAKCTRNMCDIEVNVQPHVDQNFDGACDDCGYDKEETSLWHTECEYCGKLEGEDRWFIAKVDSASIVKPLGSGCFEAISAGEAGISLNVSGFAQGDIVRITYNGMIMESYPVQIHADSIEPVE